MDNQNKGLEIIGTRTRVQNNICREVSKELRYRKISMVKLLHVSNNMTPFRTYMHYVLAGSWLQAANISIPPEYMVAYIFIQHIEIYSIECTWLDQQIRFTCPWYIDEEENVYDSTLLYSDTSFIMLLVSKHKINVIVRIIISHNIIFFFYKKKYFMLYREDYEK